MDGFDLVLERLGALGAHVLDVYIDTRATADLSLADRRLDPGDDHSYPIDLTTVDDVSALRVQLLRSMAAVGRAPGTKGGGNQRKRTRLVLALPDDWTTTGLADALSSGTAPTREPTHANRAGQPTA